MFNPLSLFSTIKSAAITIGVVAAITFVGTVWYQKTAAEAKVIALEVEKQSLKQDLFQEQIRAKGLTIVIDTLQSTYTKLAENLKQETQIDKEITDAPETDDAPAAPVLTRTMRSLDRVLHGSN